VRIEVGEESAAKESFRRVINHLTEADKQHGIFDPENKLGHDLARLEKMIDQLEEVERAKK